MPKLKRSIMCIIYKRCRPIRVYSNVSGAMHSIYYINRLTTTKVDSTYLGCLTSNTQRICL